jgi:hypothetical protein
VNTCDPGANFSCFKAGLGATFAGINPCSALVTTYVNRGTAAAAWDGITGNYEIAFFGYEAASYYLIS